MSINKYQPHLLILPEDDATSNISNGFMLHAQVQAKAIQILSPAKGWTAVVEKFKTHYAPSMRKYPQRWMVLLIDFARIDNRFEQISEQIPNDLKSRVFILGVFDEPETLKKSLGKSFESIGEALATNCAENTDQLWKHELLKHNQSEVSRMIENIRPFLFKK
jgi:hypothetical protein